MLLADKICIVTGAASQRGIGRATARLFALHGGRAIILDLDGGAAAAAASELGDAHRGYACDVTDKAACEAATAEALAAFGRIDILVNNAGITQPVKTLEITGADYDRILDVSLRGTLYMSQAAIPAMRRQKSGSIVCISSVSAQRGGGIFGGPHYSAAKAGVLGLARAMAREFGAEGIRVNCITPGLIETDITQGKLSPEKKAEIAATIPLNRLGRADDVAGCCLFLASDLSGYCTGITLDVNGGMLIH
jgi:NAD(P)-dependent dehydrogenase (short-subunit alcohol dehydrogenase family)